MEGVAQEDYSAYLQGIGLTEILRTLTLKVLEKKEEGRARPNNREELKDLLHELIDEVMMNDTSRAGTMCKQGNTSEGMSNETSLQGLVARLEEEIKRLRNQLEQEKREARSLQDKYDALQQNHMKASADEMPRLSRELASKTDALSTLEQHCKDLEREKQEAECGAQKAFKATFAAASELKKVNEELSKEKSLHQKAVDELTKYKQLEQQENDVVAKRDFHITLAAQRKRIQELEEELQKKHSN